MTAADIARVKVAIVGCGGIGNSHARAYTGNPRVELVGVVDKLDDRAADYAARYNTTAYRSIDELVEATDPDLVSVATPPGAHLAPTLELLDRGCSVLLEKPPTASLADFDVLVEAERHSAGQVYPVVQHRHGSGARRARRLLSAGDLGRPRVAVCETLWYRPDSYFDLDWRGSWAGEGGGPTLGHGIHQIDLLLHLLGPWDTLQARSARLARQVEFEDVSLAMVTFAEGAIGSIVTSLLSPRELSRIRIDTSGGTLEVDHVYGYRDADWSWYPAPDAGVAAVLGRDPGEERNGSTEGADPVGPTNPWDSSAEPEVPSNHAAQIDRLVDDALAGRDHDTTLDSVRSTLELVTALYASSLAGEPVHRRDLVAGHAFYDRLDGGLPADEVTSRLAVLPW